LTEKPKEQLSRFFSPQLGVFLIFLTCFYLYATLVEPSFFVFLSSSLLLVIFYLLPLRSRLRRKQAEVSLHMEDLRERVNLLDAEMNHEKVAIESFRSKIVSYSQLKGVTERLGLCLTLEDTSRTLSVEVDQLFGQPETTIILYLFHSKTGELGLSSSQKGQMSINLKSKKGDEFDQWIVKTMQPLLIEDTKSDFRFDMDKIVMEETRAVRSLISTPLMVGNKALGILRMDSPHPQLFHTEDLRFLTTIGDIGAIAIENAQLYEQVEQLAIRDGLTGLYLRRYLLERLPEEMARQLRRKGQLSFFMIDLDNFKQYNDRFGHVAGDIVLRTLGQLLADMFSQPGNLAFRYGGEEFAVMLPDCPRTKALELAEQLRKRIEKETILLRREETHITVSIGVATFPKDAQTKEELIQNADQALYKAKGGGRNRVCIFETS